MREQLQDETRSHYDAFPFIEGGGNRVEWWSRYLEDFLPAEDIAGSLMIDVGSSVGEISRGLLNRGARMVCLDLSLESLRRCRVVNPEAEVFNGSALELPFADETFDHAISIGVLHHTPDCRRGFSELARVTAPGGTVVVFLYNWWSIYNPIFHAFRPVSRLLPLERVPLWLVRTMQPFARTHLGQKLDDAQLRRLLGDKLWTPQATFHSVSEVRRWGAEEGLRYTANKRFYLGYANVMRFVKEGERQAAPREVVVRCTRCGEAPMKREDHGYSCAACGAAYASNEGIYRCIPSD